MYVSNLRRVSGTPRYGVHLRPRVARPLLPLGPAPATHGRTTIVRRMSDQSKSATTAVVEGAEAAWQSASTKLKDWAKVPSASTVAGAIALVPVVGGAWLVTVYALRQQLCEHRLQQVWAFLCFIIRRTELFQAVVPSITIVPAARQLSALFAGSLQYVPVSVMYYS